MRDVAIVVPTLNEEAWIEDLLFSLADQEAPSDTYCVVIVDTGSIDNTLGLIKGFKQLHPKLAIEVVHMGAKGVGPARKYGFDLALSLGANFLLSTDADCVVPNTFVSEFRSRMKKARNKVFAGKIRHPAEFVLFLALYFEDTMVLMNKLAQLRDEFFGSRLNGAYFGVTKELYSSLYLGDMRDPLIQQEDYLIGSRCWYMGVSFLQSYNSVLTSDRRFWGNPLEWASHKRETNYRDRKRNTQLIHSLSKNEIHKANNLRTMEAVERIHRLFVDAMFLTTIDGKKYFKAKRAAQKAARFFGIPLHFLRPVLFEERWEVLDDWIRHQGTTVQKKVKDYVK